VRRIPGLLPLGLLLLAGPAAHAASPVPTVHVSGVVQLLHADPADPASLGRYEFALRTTTGLFELHPRPGVTLPPGTFVTVTATRSGRMLDVSAAQQTAPRTTAERRLAQPARFAEAAPTLAAVLINFSSDSRQPFSAASVSQLLYGAGASVSAYYLEQSFGRTQLSGTVLGWYTIPDTPDTCDYATWASQARAAAGSALDGYDHVMYLFPTESSCGWAGLGDLPGPETWINGYLQLRVLAHELGHNLGVHHANALQCSSGGLRTALTGTCSSVEYGDPFSVMGSGSTQQFPAYHKGELGWLSPTSTYTVTASGTYTVAPSEDTTGAVQLLRIVRGSDALYVDFRQPFGTFFDVFAPGTPPVNGVMIRQGPLAYNQTQPSLIDTTPQTSTYQDAALTPGNSLTDPGSGITIETDAVAPDSATVTITMPSAGQAPSAPGNVTAAVAGSNVDVSWQAATDDGSIAHYKVYRSGTLLATLGPGTLSYQDTPPTGQAFVYAVAAVDDSAIQGQPGASQAVSVGDATPPSIPTGVQATVAGHSIDVAWVPSVDDVGVDHYLVFRDGVLLGSPTGTSFTDASPGIGQLEGYAVRAVDDSGNESAASGTATATVPDTTPPTAPGMLHAVTHRTPLGVTLTWQASTDDVAVTGYRIWRDGVLQATVETTTYTDGWTETYPSVIYAVAAVDEVGHESEHSSVVAYAPPPDTTPPTAPSPVRVTAARSGHVVVSWGAGHDDLGVVRYEVVYRGRVLLPTTKRTAVLHIHGRHGARLMVGVRAVDAAGNRSAPADRRFRMH
jgi:hypothetical protein